MTNTTFDEFTTSGSVVPEPQDLVDTGDTGFDTQPTNDFSQYAQNAELQAHLLTQFATGELKLKSANDEIGRLCNHVAQLKAQLNASTQQNADLKSRIDESVQTEKMLRTALLDAQEKISSVTPPLWRQVFAKVIPYSAAAIVGSGFMAFLMSAFWI